MHTHTIATPFLCPGLFYLQLWNLLSLPTGSNLEALYCLHLCAMLQLKQMAPILLHPHRGQELLMALNVCAALCEPPRAAQSRFLSSAQTQVCASGPREEPWKGLQCTRCSKAQLSSFPRLPFSFSLLLPQPSQIVSFRPPRGKG